MNLCPQASLSAVARARFGGALGGYNLAQTTQYHIQTDEGPERYFRYQTDSGQYRKEKRLEVSAGVFSKLRMKSLAAAAC